MDGKVCQGLISADGKSIAVMDQGEKLRLTVNANPWSLDLPGDGDVFDGGDNDRVSDDTSGDEDYVRRPPKPAEPWSPIF